MVLSRSYAVAAAVILALFPSSAGAESENPRARHLILITVDTLRADALGFAGNDRVETPTLDRLARTGRVFGNAHAHSVMTLPSHTNILTGKLPYEHGVRENSGFEVPDHIPTLATVLHSAGFATAAFVGAFPLDARFGLARGFDVYDDHIREDAHGNLFGLGERPGSDVVSLALDWWQKSTTGRKFLWVHVFEPHAPYQPPEPFAKSYARKPYLGEVAATDHFLTPLLAPLLDREGAKAPETLVIFTSDHGESLGAHGELTHGVFAYEPTLKIPLVLWGPGITPGIDSRWARHVDLLPTALDALGVAIPPDLHPAGLSLLTESEEPEPRETYFEAMTGVLTRGWAPLRGTIKNGSKLIDLPIQELYDLPSDPQERQNLVSSRREEAAALRRGLPSESQWPPGRGKVDEEVEERLRALGYATGSAPGKSSYGPEDDPKNLVELDRKLQQLTWLYNSGRLDETIRLSQEIIRARPEMEDAHTYLAIALLRQGQSRQALAAMERARATGAASDSLIRQEALTLTTAGQSGKAVRILEPLTERPSGPEASTLNTLGIALLESGHMEEGIRTLESIFHKDPSNAWAHETLSLAYQRQGSWPQAREHAQKAIDLDPGRAVSWVNLGVALLELEKPQEALKAWDRALELDPSQLGALFNLGIVAAQIGQTEEAREALSSFVNKAPAERFAAEVARAREVLDALPQF
jgi:arylsulfatase A-like enzyme/Tfp pilus assembly protein PilF